MLLAQMQWGELQPFVLVAGVVSLVMLIWDTVEVGRNDAANLVNAVFGARVMLIRNALYVAAGGVILGAASSSQVMDTARKGIFDPGQLDLHAALSVYVAVYIVDTVLLYSFSAFGMPVSTTACLVFELLGASFALGGPEVVNWSKASQVILAIVMSIVITGAAAFVIQRAVRGAVGDRTTDLRTLRLHGAWIGGGMLAALTYFMLVKGMKYVAAVKSFNVWVADNFAPYGAAVVIVSLWLLFGVLIQVLLFTHGARVARRLFAALAVIGTFAMAFAFGQNDLANAASPGLASLNLIKNMEHGTAAASEVPIRTWALVLCGLLMAMGMMTQNAKRVTRAAVNAGSQANTVRLWAPRPFVAIARGLLRLRGDTPALAPAPSVTAAGKALHYDVLRACVILAVSASVIATASGFGLPVSTTYVSFAAIVTTGMADRILQRGDADLKLARTIWVVFSWFAAAVIAAIAGALVATTINRLEVVGIILVLVANLVVRQFMKGRADRQEETVRLAAQERRAPEDYAEEEA